MTTTNEPDKADDAPDSAHATSVPRRRRLGVFLQVILFLLVFAVAWVVSGQFHPPAVEEPGTEHPKTELVAIPQKRIGTDATPAEILERGDEALIQYRFIQAISHYEELLQTDAIRLPPIDYRLGLCSEFLDRVDKAIGYYRSAVSAASSPTLSCTCQIGIARCFLRQDRAADARRLLYPLLLDEKKQHEIPAALISDARSLLALAWAREVQTPPADKFSLDEIVPFSQIALEAPVYLEETAKTTSQPKEPAAKKPDAKLLVEKQTDGKAAHVREIEQPDQPAMPLMDRLAHEAGMRSEWTPSASKKTQDRTIRVNVRHWELPDLLECLADQFDLLCRIEGNTVFFCTAQDADAKIHQPGAQATGSTVSLIRRAAATRALTRAAAAEVAHPYTAAVFLELGNAEAAIGKTEEAARWYERITRETSTSAYLVLARYNLAQLHLRKKDYAQARKAFYQVVDQAPAHEFALRAYLRLGRLFLADEENLEALVCLRRARALAPHSPFRPVATLTLTAALLKLGDPESARAAMEADRATLHQEQYKATTTFLDAYANYQIAKATDSARREATGLLSTLWHYREATVIGQFGKYLVAEAYAELSFPHEAERVLTQAAAESPGPVMTCIEFRLGEVLLKKGQVEAARASFQKIAQAPSPYRPQARFNLARLDLGDKRWKECAAKCQELWKEQSFSEPGVLLQLWGSALEGSGDLARAAQCFAGKAPE